MNTYLAIMITILILTQVIRLIQNTLHLRHFKHRYKATDAEVMETWNRLVEGIEKLNDRLEGAE